MEDDEKDDFSFDEEEVFGTTYPKSAYEEDGDTGGMESWGGKLSHYEGSDPKTKVVNFLKKNWKLITVVLFIFFIIFLLAVFFATRSGDETVSPNSPCWPDDQCASPSSASSAASSYVIIDDPAL
eukprot:CAMPEP_0184340380 /NCGR_PEP_ID=MMETSP1089-20130417/9073_1 /TAXON_ID=38269 ORGANISM="Gloeochaete wittrockiana, Strain SAG46.84" /NCGR_SAMPLE_ID=MMETSP1089 /ASSEMBLY_ACC=CAM_ASM_000445 /LENGTH=124 /DNA_ID=CAMNT_0026668177 /DNA_START=97 /DNA_END=471 /DNA_ORIENTATION=+